MHENLLDLLNILKYILIYDGVHALLPKFGGTGEVFVQIERATREFRKWGVGLILLSQVIKDFPAEVLANINTQIQMRTRDEGDLQKTREEYGESVVQSLVKASQGTGMVESASYNKGKPFFVDFRPIMHSNQRVSDEELVNYTKYNGIIDDLDYQLEQLELEGLDIFDLRLELKLAQDKVKSGSFNMVDIYLEGLKPRIKQQWDKLGKVPKKKAVKQATGLKEELEKAKKQQTKESPGEDNEPSEENSSSEDYEESRKTESTEESKEIGLDEITQQLHDAIDNDDSNNLSILYAQLQRLYKSASKEDKAKILEDFNLIKEKMAKK